MEQLQLGIDHFLLQAPLYKNKRLALVTNDAARTSSGQPGRQALLQAGFTVTQLFSPEHGINAAGADGVLQPHGTDTLTGLPVISLYGHRLAPTAADLQHTDMVLFDIPDVGCRFYTYLWTLTHIMEACAQYHKPLLLLDRPNPIGINLLQAEGPMLDEQHCASFIGRWNIPLRHSCSLGELALYFAATKMSGLDITIIKVTHYSRRYSGQQDPTFVPTSPAIRDIETALLYPGMGLLEAVNVNEGRGTALPFKFCGAPWIDAATLVHCWNKKNIPGVKVISHSCVPASGLYAGQLCHGLQFAVTSKALLQPVAMGLHLLQTLLQCYPQQLTERRYLTAANPTGAKHLDKLLGVAHAFEKLQQGIFIDTALGNAWAATIAPYLLY